MHSFSLYCRTDKTSTDFYSAGELYKYLRGGWAYAPASYLITEYNDQGRVVNEVEGSSFLATYELAQPAPTTAPRTDKRKQKGEQYKATILTAGGWELHTGGFTGSLPDVVAWVTERVPSCAAYLKIYRGIKETGGVWAGAYPGEAMQHVFVTIASKTAISAA